jgi:hypothetical protein
MRRPQVWTSIEVTDFERRLFFQAIEKIRPEVLEGLRTSVWPLYQRDAPMRRKGAHPLPPFPIRRWSPALLAALFEYAIRHNLTRKGKPLDWAPAQIEQTLDDWLRNPELLDLRPLRWNASGGYGMHQRPADFLLGGRLPAFIEWTRGENVEQFRARIDRQLDRKIRPQLRTLA